MRSNRNAMPGSPLTLHLLTDIRTALLWCAFLALPAMAQPNPPFVFSAENSASYAGTIAQGSLFIVFGANIGPAKLIQASSLPLPSQIGGTAITVTSGSITIACPMVYSAMDVAAAVLPSNVPPGSATLTLTYNGRSTPFPATVDVVPSAVGIYTLGSSGLGFGIFTGIDGSVKTFAGTAKNGETVTAWATGLGPIGGSDNVIPLAFPNFPGVEVFVGTQAANVIYAGRSGCCVALDQISFEIPTGVTGCYVPVAVHSGGTISNFVSIAVSSDGGPCSDTVPTVPISIMNQASAGQPVKAAALAAGPVSVLRGLGFDEKLYLAETLSKLLHVNFSQQDVAKLLRRRESPLPSDPDADRVVEVEIAELHGPPRPVRDVVAGLVQHQEIHDEQIARVDCRAHAARVLHQWPVPKEAAHQQCREQQ